MLAGCIGLPLLLLVFFGGRIGVGGNWLAFGLIALCIGSHFAMMLGGHGGRLSAAADGAKEKTDEAKKSPAKEENTHGGYCH